MLLNSSLALCEALPYCGIGIELLTGLAVSGQAHYSIILQLLQHGDTDVNQALSSSCRSVLWSLQLQFCSLS